MEIMYIFGSLLSRSPRPTKPDDALQERLRLDKDIHFFIQRLLRFTGRLLLCWSHLLLRSKSLISLEVFYIITELKISYLNDVIWMIMSPKCRFCAAVNTRQFALGLSPWKRVTEKRWALSNIYMKLRCVCHLPDIFVMLCEHTTGQHRENSHIETLEILAWRIRFVFAWSTKGGHTKLYHKDTTESVSEANI